MYDLTQAHLVYHFCRLRLPAVTLSFDAFQGHLRRAYRLYEEKRAKEGETVTWQAFLENLHALDLFLASACLEGITVAWEYLFASRANRTDCLLVDALRARAIRLFPRDELKQEQAVAEFWGFLLVTEKEGQTPILARYDGQRPLIPWLIRIFQNKHLSDLRQNRRDLPIDEDFDPPQVPVEANGEEHWHEEFRVAAREWLGELKDDDLLLLGLRIRYRMSQREVAAALKIHEGNVSRRTDKLREHCLERISTALRRAGWTGEDLNGFVLKEMESLLLDEPRLSADRLAQMLARRTKKV